MDASAKRMFSGWISALFIALAVTAARFGWRAKARALAWDDVPMALSFFFTAIAATNYITVITVDMSKRTALATSYLTWTSYLASPIAVWTCRIALASHLARLLPRGSWLRKGAAVGVGVLSCMCLALVLAIVFMCGTPVPENLVCDIPWRTTTTTLIFNCVAMAWLSGWCALTLVATKPAAAFRRWLIGAIATAGASLAFDAGHAAGLYRAEMVGRVANYKALNATGNMILFVPLVGANILAFMALRWPDTSQSTLAARRASDSESVSSTDKKPEPAIV